MSETVTIANGRLSAAIDPNGAQLTSLALDGAEYLWQRDPRWWAKAAPILFPVVGAPGSEVLRSASGPCRVPKHGFARDFEHAVKEVSPSGDAVTFELADTSATRELYPYAFNLRMTYALTGPATLAQTFRVENTGDAPMPFSVGGHPAFNVPAPNAGADTALEDYDLRFAERWTACSPKMVEGGLMSYADPFEVIDDTDTLPLTRSCFDYDTIVLRDVPRNMVELRGRTSGHGVRVDFPGFDFVGIWSAQPDAPFVAIEPWTGHAALDTEDDIFEHRDNITILAPGEVDERTFEITVF
ncbi:MAG: aldose 1-epimerase family protein [Coriobacteriaceae bacterium]|nr:aldose 1-epimerase family protein [Coriobacteriaceae bacterium]